MGENQDLQEKGVSPNLPSQLVYSNKKNMHITLSALSSGLLFMIRNVNLEEDAIGALGYSVKMDDRKA